MRLWSLHPKHLDTKGLVALWREALLAKHVLAGQTRGYRNHPQLRRFREVADPLNAINYYLSEVFREAEKRGYSFAGEKIDWNFKPVKIPVNTGQLEYERLHLLHKLEHRDPAAAIRLTKEPCIATHPIFEPVPGGIESWEVQ